MRAPEFYGPGKTQSFTNALVIDALKAGKKPRVPVRDDTRRTLIWTPDANRALAIEPLYAYWPYTVPAGIASPPVESIAQIAVQSDVYKPTFLETQLAVAVLYCDNTVLKPLPAAPTLIQTDPLGRG